MTPFALGGAAATVTLQFSLQPTTFLLPSYQTHLSSDILSGVARGWGLDWCR